MIENKFDQLINEEEYNLLISILFNMFFWVFKRSIIDF